MNVHGIQTTDSYFLSLSSLTIKPPYDSILPENDISNI